MLSAQLSLSTLREGVVDQSAHEANTGVSYIANLDGIEFGLQHHWRVSRHIHVRLLFVPGIAIQWLVDGKTAQQIREFLTTRMCVCTCAHVCVCVYIYIALFTNTK